MPRLFSAHGLLGLCLAMSACAAHTPATDESTRPDQRSAPEPRPVAEQPVEQRMGGIVYGVDHAFEVVAPAGWVLDNKSGQPQNLHAVFYPDGGSWSQSLTIMYANVAKKGPGQETVELVMAVDDKRFNDRNPGIEILELEAITTTAGKRARIKTFAKKPGLPTEAVAYLDEKKVVVFLVLSSRDPESFSAALPAFDELVTAYRLFTKDVKIKVKDGLEPARDTP
jgi:hypothetical protein